MTTPDERHGEQPSFETFRLGWRIPPAILEPLLHPPAAAEERDVDANVPVAPPDAG